MPLKLWGSPVVWIGSGSQVGSSRGPELHPSTRFPENRCLSFSTHYEWLVYFRGAADHLLIESRSVSGFFVPGPKFPPRPISPHERPEILQKCQLGKKHLELERRPHIHTRGFRAHADVEKSSEAVDEA